MHIEWRYRDLPHRRILSGRMRTLPTPLWLEGDISALQAQHLAIGTPIRTTTVWITGAITPTEVINHHITPICEMESKPIPANLIGRQCTRTPLTVHPTIPCDGHDFSTDAQRTDSGHACQ